jgi:putative ABC transport system substrate-binding protein
MLDQGRRNFIALLGGAALWPSAARAQPAECPRRIGVLMTLAASDPDAQPRMAAFERGLRELGWVEGRNLRIERRWVADDAGELRRAAHGVVLPAAVA